MILGIFIFIFSIATIQTAEAQNPGSPKSVPTPAAKPAASATPPPVNTSKPTTTTAAPIAKPSTGAPAKLPTTAPQVPAGKPNTPSATTAPTGANPAVNQPVTGAPVPEGTPIQQNPAIPGVPQPEEFGEENSGLVLKKNSFTYDGNEGRDPFKIFREIPIIIGGNPDSKGPEPKVPNFSEKNIRTALIPTDVNVVGILFRKVDPIALVAVKGVKGLNKLKVGSPIGRNDGKVIEIKRDQIIVEQIKDFDGQKFTEKVPLTVRKKKD